MNGVVLDIRPIVVADRLKVAARVRTQECGELDAYLPDRETAAFLPRTLLVSRRTRAPRSLLGSIAPILRRFAVGREVRLWRYEDRYYLSFPSWRSVRFDSSAQSGGTGARTTSA